jgi:hypothetical protein
VSLRSMNFGVHYLRHQDFRLKLEASRNTNDEQTARQFRQDAMFFIEFGGIRPLGGASRHGFRRVSCSFNFPDRFIRRRDFHLFVEGGTGDAFFGDRSFHIPAREL